MAFPTTNLRARYEAKDESGLSDGDPYNPITDQSGNGFDMGRWAGSSDNWYDTTYSIGGQAIYNMTSTGNYRYVFGTPATKNAYSLCAVLNSGAAEASSRELAAWDIHDATTSFLAILETAAGEWEAWLRTTGTGAGDSQIDTSGVDTTVNTVITATWDGSTLRMYVDGTEVGTGQSRTGDISENTFAAGYLFEYFTGRIALMAAWDKALDASERADLHTYVQDTYGITVSDYASSGNVGVTVTNYHDLQ